MPHGRGPCRGFWKSSGARSILSPKLCAAGSFAARSRDRDEALSVIFSCVVASASAEQIPPSKARRATGNAR